MNRVYVSLLIIGALTFTGCQHSNPPTGGTPTTSTPPISYDTIKSRANQAGLIAGSGFVILNHPSQDEATAVKQVIALVAVNLRSYQAGGFTAAAPAICTAVDQACPANLVQYLPLSHSLVSIMTLELDSLFASHPDWQSQGNDVAGIITAFCDGASAALNSYVARGVPVHRVYVCAGRGYEWNQAGTAREFVAPTAPVYREVPVYVPDPNCKTGKCPLIKR
jgi:hypothetical protein